MPELPIILVTTRATEAIRLYFESVLNAEALDEYQIVAMTQERLARITIDDAQCGGRPCIRGMRIRVTDILELLSAGGLEREDVLASVESTSRRAHL